MNIPQQIHVVVNDVTWYLFSAQFLAKARPASRYETPDWSYEAHCGTMHFYAISFYRRRSRRTSEAKYHAEIVLQDLKATARLTGQVVGAYAA